MQQKRQLTSQYLGHLRAGAPFLLLPLHPRLAIFATQEGELVHLEIWKFIFGIWPVGHYEDKAIQAFSISFCLFVSYLPFPSDPWESGPATWCYEEITSRLLSQGFRSFFSGCWNYFALHFNLLQIGQSRIHLFYFGKRKEYHPPKGHQNRYFWSLFNYCSLVYSNLTYIATGHKTINDTLRGP